MAQLSDLDVKSIEYRQTILRVIKHANAGHTGGSLSCVDILNVLYNRILNVSAEKSHSADRDRYIHSKGHSVEALYVVLAERGFISSADLETVCRFQSDLIGHPTRKVNGIEHNTGALGHGLSFAVGVAFAAKLDSRPYRVFVLLGDGELAEGSNWEACLAAAHYGLDQLVVIVDRNHLQISGRTEEVMSPEPLMEKFQAFGMAVRNVDGHNLAELEDIFRSVPFVKGKPSLILANTVKGRGISFMENQTGWHHHVTSEGEYEQAMAELEQARKNLLDPI
jgi:transketolase